MLKTKSAGLSFPLEAEKSSIILWPWAHKKSFYKIHEDGYTWCCSYIVANTNV